MDRAPPKKRVSRHPTGDVLALFANEEGSSEPEGFGGSTGKNTWLSHRS